MNKVHYSSATDNWETPQEVFDKLNEEFDLEIPDEDAEKITTVQNAIDYANTHHKA